MGEAIFESVLLNLLDSFVPHVDSIFTKFDADLSQSQRPQDEMDVFLQKTILGFPKMVDSYQKTLDTIVEFATSNPDPSDPILAEKTSEKVSLILCSLCSKFKSEANRSAEKDFTLIHIASPAFRSTSFYHFQFLRTLTLVILTDIIQQIYIKSPNPACISKIVPCAFHNCVSPHRLSLIQNDLIAKWSFVIQCVSKISIADISLAFEQYIDESNSHLVIALISKITANDKFVETILYTFQQQKKHKTLAATALSSLSLLLSHAKCKMELLNEFFQLAWSVKTTPGVKDGAIDLITSLFNRIPKEAKKASSFYSSRVMKHIGTPSKLPRTAHAFLRLIQGDISNVECQAKPNKLSFVGCCGTPYDSNSFANLFMKSFFLKSNFSVCPEIFIDILIHLAAIDIKSFNTIVLPQFLKVNFQDVRYSILLSSAAFINKKEFLANAFCKPDPSFIRSMNDHIRTAVLDSVLELEKYSLQQKLIFRDSDIVTSHVEECDQIVNDFLTIRKYIGYESEHYENNPAIIYDYTLTFASSMLSVMPSVLIPTDYANDHITKSLLVLSTVENLFISSSANEVLDFVFADPESQQYIIKACIQNAQNAPTDIFQGHCIAMLYNLIHSKNPKLTEANMNDIEAISIIAIGWDSPIARYHALSLLKYLSNIKEGSVFELLDANNEMICESAKLSILVLTTPPKPSITAPPRGVICWEHVCCSRHNSFWHLFYLECINVIIEYQCYEILDHIREMIYPKMKQMLKSPISNSYICSGTLALYFNTFARDPDQDPVFFDGHTIDYHFNSIIDSKNMDLLSILLKTLRFWNWRVLNNILLLIRSFPPEFIEITAKSMSFIIQMPNNFSHILTTAFRPFIEFMSMLQAHFTTIGINNTRQIIWDNEKIELLNNHDDIAVNYCIIIAAVFNNILDQIPEDEWPLSTRQILVQFLYHWCQLPQLDNKVRAYAINALIPIMKAGTIFTDGFQFELPMLEIMVECQIAGYDVLSSVLLFHFDLMFDIFVRQIFVRPRRESSLFFEAVLTSFDVCAEAQLMQAHVGSLLLLTQFWGRDNPEPAKPILITIADLFIDQATNSDVQGIIEKAENLDFVPVMFSFATEQVIEAGFEIMKSTKLVFTVKNIVSVLVTWFSSIRVLPTNKNIIQGIPSKFRRFNVISFLRAMSEVSKCVNEEQHEAFSSLWYELLRFTDNSVVVLLCIFEFEDTAIKERIFNQLLDREPALVTKYLAKRCSFAFWYFIQTEQNQNINNILWMLPVLTHAFTDHVGTDQLVTLHYTTVLHFSLLYIEQTYKFFEDLISVFGPEFTDSVLQMAPDLEGDTINIGHVASKLAEGLHEINSTALEQWSSEAFKWGVCCNDVKVATRSLIVFNALRGEFQPSFVPLLCDAASYHMRSVIQEDCRPVAEFIGECFEIFYNNIDVPEVTSIAFEFASEFLNFKEIGNKFLRLAMPIFKYCAQDPIMASAAKEILIQAFTPFAPSLETDVEAQTLLKDIISISNAPEALLVASPFIKRKLPFIVIERTYEEIMETPFDSLHATIVLQMFTEMLRTAGQPLVDAILDVSTELLRRFKDCISPAVLNPIYCSALTKVSLFRSAIEFIMIVAIIDPAIATYSSQIESESTKSFEMVRQKIQSLVKENVEPIPITNCRIISQLRGIIDQQNPPKITPFSTQHEMFVGLKRAEESNGRTHIRVKRMSSTTSIARGLAFTNRSSVMSLIANQGGDAHTTIKKLPDPVVKEHLYHKSENDNQQQFLLSIEEFAQLEP